jgi:hypothetical protein
VIVDPHLVVDGRRRGGQRRHEPCREMPRRLEGGSGHDASVARGWAERYTSHSRAWLTVV